ncbi:hypothetical protein BJ508DRAFT_362920 [Ascobolus immersus RN42]|uniref:Uncharacterized protein n=1 Tax=Ascobolus immersus RN42 TaxID=1160509 RepID=A0A3N4I596_ASCIM|nr:hypothetical protein BJ508DRAFT_362920 [Ascobolus immersus RN42]
MATYRECSPAAKTPSVSTPTSSRSDSTIGPASTLQPNFVLPFNDFPGSTLEEYIDPECIVVNAPEEIADPYAIVIHRDFDASQFRIFSPNLKEPTFIIFRSYLDSISSASGDEEDTSSKPLEIKSREATPTSDTSSTGEAADTPPPPYFDILKSFIADDAAYILTSVGIIAEKLHLYDLYDDAFDTINDLLSSRRAGWTWYDPEKGTYWKGRVKFSPTEDITPMGSIELARLIYANTIRPAYDEGNSDDEPPYSPVDDSDIQTGHRQRKEEAILKSDGRTHLNLFMSQLASRTNDIFELTLKFISTRMQYYRYDPDFTRALKSLPQLSYDVLIRYPALPASVDSTPASMRRANFQTCWNENKKNNRPDWDEPTHPNTLDRVLEGGCPDCLGAIEKLLKKRDHCSAPIRNSWNCMCGIDIEEDHSWETKGDENCFYCTDGLEEWQKAQVGHGLTVYTLEQEAKELEEERKELEGDLVELEEGGGVWLAVDEWDEDRQEWADEVAEEAEALDEESKEMQRLGVTAAEITMKVRKRKRKMESKERKRRRLGLESDHDMDSEETSEESDDSLEDYDYYLEPANEPGKEVKNDGSGDDESAGCRGSGDDKGDIAEMDAAEIITIE